MQIFKVELKSWMPGEFAPLKSKHDGGVAEANQQNLLNVIVNKVKQSFLHCHCEPKARQSFQLHNNGLPRRYAPRNDDVVASNGLPHRYAPRNDGGVASNGLPRRYAPRNDDVVASNGLPRRYAPRNDDGVASNGLPRRCAPRNDDGGTSNRLPRRCAPRNDDVVASNRLPRRFAPRNDDVVASNGLPRRYAPRNDDGVANNRLPRRCAPRNDGGRSMIEMLGVLAIIGVLSVGGLAGYSKAMENYKINRFRSGVAELLSNFLHVKEQLAFEKGGWTQNYPEIFSAMNMLPTEFIMVDKTSLKDEFGHRVVFYHDNRTGSGFNHFGFIFVFLNDKNSSAVCRALVETAKAFHNDIWQLYRQPAKGDYYIVNGSSYCPRRSRCLKNLTLADIEKICYYYNGKDPNEYQYNIQIVFKS